MTARRYPPAVQRGFTLIEVLVVVAIIGVLAYMATPNLIKLVRSSKVTAATRTIFGALSEAQGQAAGTGKTHCVKITRDPAQWELQRDDNSDGTCEVSLRTVLLGGPSLGPDAGYAAAFPSPFDTTARDTWCTFAGGGTTCTISFADDNTAVLTPGGGTSGSIAIYDGTNSTQRIGAVVIMAGTGVMRAFTAN